MRGFLTVLVLSLIALVIIGALSYDKRYAVMTYNDFSGGLNIFSSPANLQDNQFLSAENFLFYGLRLRARKGITDLNSTGISSEPITGVCKFQKTPEFSQILAACDGNLWLYDTDTDSFSALLSYSLVDLWVADSVIVTQDDSIVRGSSFDSLSYLDLGYDDSIQIFLNDTSYYVYQILLDTLLYLYEPYRAATDSNATLNQAFPIAANKPTQFDAWVNYLFIPGLFELGKYDGEDFGQKTLDITEYEIDTVYMSGVAVIIDATESFGIDYGDWNGYYVVAYNDTVSDPKLNIPIKIRAADGGRLELIGDSLLVVDGHLEEGQKFKVIPPFPYKKLVYAGKVDTLYEAPGGTMEHWVFDTSQSWTETGLNFGHYIVWEPGEGELEDREHHQSFTKIRNDGTYNYLFVNMSPTHFTLAEGDSFEVYRLSNSRISDIPLYVCHWQDRQWLAGYSDVPNLLRYSELFDPDDYPVTYFIYVNEDDGDVITVIIPLPFQDMLLVGKKKHIYSITGEGPYDWWVNDLVSGIGMPVWSSVISYGRMVFFYDYTGFYSFDGLNIEKISWAIEPIIADSINKDYAHMIVGDYFDQHLWWSYPSGSATVNNRTTVYNLETGAWTNESFSASAYFVGQIETEDDGILIGDPDSGKVYVYGGSYFDNGDSILATYESPWFDVGDENDFLKVFKDIQLVYDKHDSTVIYIDYYLDYVNTVIWTDTIGVDDSDHLTYHKRAIQGDMIGQRIKLRMRVARIDETFQLAFFRIKYKVVGEVRYDED